MASNDALGRRRSLTRAGVTLLETVLTLVVLGIVAAVLAPVAASAGDAYSSAVRTGERFEAATYALERVQALLREIPPGSVPGEVGIATLSAGELIDSDGRGVRLRDGTLWLVEGADEFPLCREVTVFELTPLAKDAVTDTTGTPARTQRVRVRLVADGVEACGAAFIRARIGNP